jgi:exodeoxyribonuclease-3
MAYRKKAGLIALQKPDIAIIPECEEPDKLKFAASIPLPNNVLWYGRNKNKGLGVFSYSDYTFQLSKDHNPDFQAILPIIVKNKRSRFMLFAIWANNPMDKKNQYIGQVWKAINYYSRMLKNKKTLLIGDFNSNTIWDKPRRAGNHSTVVEYLKKKGIHSTYHKFFKQMQGKEKHKTLFMYRHKNKPYHIDYCFASDDFIKRLSDVEVGEHTEWCKYSDHTPLITTFSD